MEDRNVDEVRMDSGADLLNFGTRWVFKVYWLNGGTTRHLYNVKCADSNFGIMETCSWDSFKFKPVLEM